MDTNIAGFRESQVVETYRRMAQSGLTLPEKYCLDLIPISSQRSILDIGIGPGRTTGPLSKLFERYTGIDYSPEMVQMAKLEFPGVDLRVMDARRLALEEPVDCVMFSYNGIDYISYEDRLSVWKRVNNQLVPGGYYVYSTHNLGYRRAKVWKDNFWVRELFRPRSHKCISLVYNRMRHFPTQSVDDTLGYAYINDPAEGFIMNSVYVEIERERELLRRHGFTVCATIGNTKQSEGYDADDSWVYIVARKA